MKTKAALAIVLVATGSLLVPAGAESGRAFPVGPPVPSIVTADPPDTLSITEFADPPAWARPQAYWLAARDQSLQGSIDQLREFRRLGLGGVSFEPGALNDSVDLAGPSVPGTGWPYPYLSEEWFAYLNAVLDEADRLEMSMYLLDTPLTMSGSAKGQVAEPARGGDPSLGWTTLAEVAPGATYQMITRPYWIDPLNPVAVQRSLELNYAAHEAHVGKHFGGALQAMWSDEVSFQPSVSPGTLRGDTRVATREIPWSPTFPAYFRESKGYDLTPEMLGKIFRPDTTADSRRVNFDYWDAVSARFADVYYGTLARWSADHHLGFIGQLISEERTPGHFSAEGSYFRAAAYPSIASTDVISNNLDMPGTPFCDGDSCLGTTQKLASSAAHLFGRRRVHLEAFDLNNDELKFRPRMMRALIDHGIARGVNLFAFHPYEFGGGGYGRSNVLYERQRIWNDYTARLQYLVAPARIRADVAVGYAPESFWIGDKQDPNAFALAGAVLQSAHRSYDDVPVEMLDDPAVRVDGGRIAIGEQSYGALVVPDWPAARLSVVRRVEEFVRGGGTLVVTGRAPAVELRGDDAPLAALTTTLFGFQTAAPPASPTSHPYGAGTVVWVPGDFTDSLQNLTPARVSALRPMIDALDAGLPARETVEGDPLLPSGLSAVELLPFRRAGRDGYFVTNFPTWQSKDPGHLGYGYDFPGQPASIVVDLPASGIPEQWDAETGTVSRVVTYDVTGNRLRIRLSLPSFGSAAIVLAPGDPAAEPHVVDTNLVDVSVSDAGVTGYLPAGASEAAFAVLARGGDVVRLERSGPAATNVPLDVVYDVSYSDGNRDRRRAGSWSEAQPETGAPARTGFVGTGTYEASIDLLDPPAAGRLIVDLGRVGDLAELRINGAGAGVRAWPPFEFDVTSAVVHGTDRMTIAVTASQAAALPNDPLYPGGLLETVTLRAEPLITLSFAD